MTQATALAIIKTGTNVFLTGEPGSGKTYVVNQYIAYLRTHGINVAITASTGIAATHISGVTIHSWSGIAIQTSLTEDELDHLASNKRLVKKIRGAQVLVIDEISMLAAGTLDLVERVCRRLRSRPEPFGGLQVVLVGDFFQLPPIRQSEEEPAQFAFASASWGEALFDICYLTEQHRQSDQALSSILAGIRGGALSETITGHLTTRRVAEHDDAKVPTKLYTHNADVDRINTEKLESLKGEVKIFSMTTKGEKRKVEQLIRGCLSPEQLELKLGAAVMCTRNNPELGFVNGTLATVVDFDPAEGYPIIKTRAGRLITVPPAEWTIEEGEKFTAVITQIPLRLAWAMTVHKSQGMSLDAAIMDLSKSFTYGQGYVALSRVRTLEGLFLLGWNQRALMIDPAIQEQDAVMRTDSGATEGSWLAQTAEQQHKRQNDFILSAGGRLQAHQEVHDGAYLTSHSRTHHIRQQHPNAYMPWTPEDDALLTDMYRGETTIKKIAATLARQTGAIRSRLMKLGLTG